MSAVPRVAKRDIAVAKDKKNKKGKKTGKGKKANGGVGALKALAQNPMVADVVAAALVATAAALKDSKRARALASDAGDELATLTKAGAKSGEALWDMALQIGRSSLEAALGGGQAAKRARPKPKAKPKAKAKPKPKAKAKAKAAPASAKKSGGKKTSSAARKPARKTATASARRR